MTGETMYTCEMYVKKKIYNSGKEVLSDLYVETFGYKDMEKLNLFKGVDTEKIEEVEKKAFKNDEYKTDEGALVKNYSEDAKNYFNLFLRSILDWAKKKYYKKRKYRK